MQRFYNRRTAAGRMSEGCVKPPQSYSRVLRRRAAFHPIFQVLISQCSLLVGGLGERGSVRVGNPALVRPGAVLGDDQPEQAKRSLPRHVLALEQHGAEQGLRPMLALVGGEPQPARRLDGVLAVCLCRGGRGGRDCTAPRDRRNRTRHSGTSRARHCRVGAMTCRECHRDDTVRASRRHWPQKRACGVPDAVVGLRMVGEAAEILEGAGLVSA